MAREVGTEGKLGGQAVVASVAGTWKDLTDNVHFMVSNLTGQVRKLAAVTTAVANGDLSKNHMRPAVSPMAMCSSPHRARRPAGGRGRPTCGMIVGMTQRPRAVTAPSPA